MYSKGKLLKEGKAKRLFSGGGYPAPIFMEFTDRLTAGNGAKQAEQPGKGKLCNSINAILMGGLKRFGIANIFIEKRGDTESLVHQVDIFPLEVIIRYEAWGSLVKRFDLKPGTALPQPLIELCWKNDGLGDPFVSEDLATMLNLINQEDLKVVRTSTLIAGHALRQRFLSAAILLGDVKFEFGRYYTDSRQKSYCIMLADEISPDTCRLRDVGTGRILDKDIFRLNPNDGSDNVISTYAEVLQRL